MPWSSLQLGEVLGEGASGHVRRAVWTGSDGAVRPVAVKLFKGAVTSDGLPEHEVAACLIAGGHPNLPGVIGPVTGHPNELQGLVLPLVPAGWRVLGTDPRNGSAVSDVACVRPFQDGHRMRPRALAPECRTAGSVSLHEGRMGQTARRPKEVAGG